MGILEKLRKRVTLRSNSPSNRNSRHVANESGGDGGGEEGLRRREDEDSPEIGNREENGCVISAQESQIKAIMASDENEKTTISPSLQQGGCCRGGAERQSGLTTVSPLPNLQSNRRCFTFENVGIASPKQFEALPNTTSTSTVPPDKSDSISNCDVVPDSVPVVTDTSEDDSSDSCDHRKILLEKRSATCLQLPPRDKQNALTPSASTLSSTTAQRKREHHQQPRRHSEGSNFYHHIFHDKLSTLYEESNYNSGDDADDDMTSLEGGTGHDSQDESDDDCEETLLIRSASIDESMMKARWEYALKAMTRVSQCHPSTIHKTVAGDLPPRPGSSSVDMDIGEI